jgi:hypothetical protein
MTDIPRIADRFMQGDDHVIEVTFSDAGGSPIDKSGHTFRLQMRTTPQSTTVAATPSVDASDLAAGVVRFVLVPEQTAGLSESLISDLEQTLPDGRVHTPLGFTHTVLREVTR